MNHGRLDTLYQEVSARKFAFFFVFMVVMIVSYGVLYAIDFIPEAPEEADTDASVESQAVTADTDVIAAEPEPEVPLADPTPDRIIIDKLDREITVLNPESTSIAALDEALLDGVVRHPHSADFEREGTMFLFGHSSYLPNVINRNFQALNGIQELEWGDKIRLQSADMEYVYRVDRTYQTKASEAEVEIIEGKPKLTLATCNSFGSKDDRYIVEATLIDSYSIPESV